MKTTLHTRLVFHWLGTPENKMEVMLFKKVYPLTYLKINALNDFKYKSSWGESDIDKNLNPQKKPLGLIFKTQIIY